MNRKVIQSTLMIVMFLGVLCTTAVSQAGANINPSVKVLTNSAGVDTNNATISFSAAQALVNSEFPASTSDSSFYCIIHVLKWKRGTTEKPIIDLQNWYTYNPDEEDRFEGLRIFGSKNVGFLYIHLNVPGSPTITSEQTRQFSANEAAQAVGRREIRSNLCRVGVEVGTGAGAGIAVRRYTEFNYTWEEKSKLPKLASDAAALFNFLTAQGTDADPCNVFREEAIILYGASPAPLSLKHKTSDITVKLFLLNETGTGQNEQISTQTYDNEGRSRFDLSLALPVNRVNELEFSAENNTVGARKIDKQKLYAFLNIFPVPIDTKGLELNRVPHLVVGVPITGKPLDNPFIGVGYGFNKVQFFVGTVFNRVREPQTLSTGAAATPAQLEADLRPRYRSKFMMGINMPVRQVIDALKPKK